MGKRVFSSLIAVNEMLTSHCDNHAIPDMQFRTRNSVMARPPNNIFELLPCLREKSESDRAAFVQRER